MKNKALFLCAAFLVIASTCLAQDNVITVQTKKHGVEIQSTMYGIFFEDINFGADGGLYAELVKNRSFEFYPDHFMGWEVFGNVSLMDDGPFERNPYYARLAYAGHNDMWTGLQNNGFFGIGLKQDAEYRFSVWARVPDGNTATLMVQLINRYANDEQQQFAAGDLTIDSKEWRKYTLILKSPCTIDNASLRIFLADADHRSGKETVDVEHVSLFPVDTWNGHENGMRKDLVQALYDLHPGIFRFPGGCIVEGTTLETRYQWKNSVGDVENRPINKNRWESTFTYRYYPDYFQSYGLGFYEFFLLSEEIGAEPLPVLNVGMSCQYQNWENEAAHVPCTQEDLQPYIDDALDLIEFANGDTNTEWGKLRTDMGHPEPFNLKFLAIGNEQWGRYYFDRLSFFINAIRKAYPEIKIIGTSGPNSEGDMFEAGWQNMKEQKTDLVDEHFYRNIDWFKNSMNRYDDYDRTGPKVFAGEWSCHDSGKKFNHAGASIYEAAFMTTLERNADVVHMAAYAPLFAHIDGWQWRPNLIWFDNLNVARTASYYVQQMYSCNKGTNVLYATLSNPAHRGDDGLFASAVIDKDSSEYIVKIINTSDTDQMVRIVLNGTKKLKGSVATLTLDCSDYMAENMLGRNEAVAPVTGIAVLDGTSINASVKAKNFVIFKIKYNAPENLDKVKK